MLSVLLLAALPLAEEPGFERMLLCKAYRAQWLWEERKAGRKVPYDFSWGLAFNKQLRAAGAAKGLSHDQVAERGNEVVAKLQSSPLTDTQKADWANCQKQLDWAPDPGSKMID